MAKRKPTKKYYFSVEGETERWYLEWLSDQINGTEESAYNVSFKIKIEKDPRKMVKSLTISGKTDIWHLSDYESNDPDHVRQFTETMDNMKKAQGMGKTVKYYFGYSNFSFDLWIVLHRMNCNQALAHRSQYLRPESGLLCFPGAGGGGAAALGYDRCGGSQGPPAP